MSMKTVEPTSDIPTDLGELFIEGQLLAKSRVLWIDADGSVRVTDYDHQTAKQRQEADLLMARFYSDPELRTAAEAYIRKERQSLKARHYEAVIPDLVEEVPF